MPLLIPLVAVPLAVLVAAVFVLGAHHAMRATADPITFEGTKAQRWFAGLAKFTVVGVLYKATQKARREASKVISRYAAASLGVLVMFLNGLTQLVHLVTTTPVSFAGAVVYAVERLRTVTIPHAIAAGTAPLRVRVKAVERRAARAFTRSRAAQLAAAAAAGIAIGVGRRSRAADRAIERALERFRNRLRTAERTLKRHTGSLRAIRRWASYAAIAGVVIRVLARKMPWLFCRRTKRWNQNMCRVNDDWITSWLEGTLIVWGGISIIEFARDAQGLAGFVMGFMEDFIRKGDVPTNRLPPLDLLH